jgi:hypothetical protein
VDLLPPLIGVGAVLLGASIAAVTATRREQLARREQSHATGQDIDLLEARVLCDDVLGRVTAWRREVKSALLQDDKQRVTAAEEDLAWTAVQQAVKEELRRLSSSRLWRERPRR